MEQIVERVLELLHYDASAPLIFNSGLFLFLFVGFSAGYVLMRRASTLRILYVILFSIYFYYKSSGIYFLLLVFVAVSDYWIAHGIAAARSKKTKRWLVALSVAVNLGMLGYFKYTNFFIEIANNIFGAGFLDFRNIFLPVGISFFVFQSMSYTIDVYRGVIRPLDRWIDYMFYLSFFPQLVAGPIVRARDFIPQIRQPLRVTRRMFGLGVAFIIIGLIKKAVISDYISLNFVDRIFDDPALYSGFECLMGIYGYALQIYCDFSGYSDMAIGIALLLGFRFPKNFDAPYKSATITEFWRRWHISLSSWFRDYVYIPLGGSREGKARTYLNLLAVWVLTGLWHGSTLNFLLWGLFLFVLIALERAGWDRVLDKSRVLSRVYMVLMIPLSWLLFAIPSVGRIGVYLGRLFPIVSRGVAVNAGDWLQYGKQYWWLLVLGIVFSTPGPEKLWNRIRSSWLGTVILAVLFWACVYCMSVATNDPFLYFSF